MKSRSCFILTNLLSPKQGVITKADTEDFDIKGFVQTLAG